MNPLDQEMYLLNPSGLGVSPRKLCQQNTTGDAQMEFYSTDRIGILMGKSFAELLTVCIMGDRDNLKKRYTN
jgi:hypothetical protein